jgi:hypothetical protein
MQVRRPILYAIAMALAASCTTLFATTATAGPSPTPVAAPVVSLKSSSFERTARTFSPATGLPYPQPYASGTAICRPGYAVVHAGAAAWDSDAGARGSLFGMLPVGGASNYAEGLTYATIDMSITCAPAEQLSTVREFRTTVRDHRAGQEPIQKRAGCPAGTWVYGGGGYVGPPDIADPNRNGNNYDQTFASFPDLRNGWYFGAIVPIETEPVLVHTVRCVSQTQVDYTTPYEATFPISAGGYASGEVSCPKGTSVLTGGAYWHRKGSGTPEAVGTLSASGAHGATSWHVDGHGGADSVLTAVVHCIPSK